MIIMRSFHGTHWLKNPDFIDRLYIWQEWMPGISSSSLISFHFQGKKIEIETMKDSIDYSWFQLQRIKTCIITSSSWGPGQLANQEPGNELPDYVICTPDNHKPENALAILTANLYIPNLTNLITAQVGVILKYNMSAVSLLSERYH